MSEGVRTAPEQVALEGGLYWGRLYWLYGQNPRGNFVSEVRDPPTSGWGTAFLIDRDPKSKKVIIFNPYTLNAYSVSRRSHEFMTFEASWTPYPYTRMAETLLRIWETYSKASWQADFDVAAVVLRMLEIPVPMNVGTPEGVEVKTSGGKAADDSVGLLKPVKRTGRRGEVLAFFLEGKDGQRSIHEAVAQFDITRSNLLSQLFLLRKDHGIGYEVKGDAARVFLPAGCTDPYDGEKQ